MAESYELEIFHAIERLQRSLDEIVRCFHSAAGCKAAPLIRNTSTDRVVADIYRLDVCRPFEGEHLHRQVVVAHVHLAKLWAEIKSGWTAKPKVVAIQGDFFETRRVLERGQGPGGTTVRESFNTRSSGETRGRSCRGVSVLTIPTDIF